MRNTLDREKVSMWRLVAIGSIIASMIVVIYLMLAYPEPVGMLSIGVFFTGTLVAIVVVSIQLRRSWSWSRSGTRTLTAMLLMLVGLSGIGSVSLLAIQPPMETVVRVMSLVAMLVSLALQISVATTAGTGDHP